MLFFFSCMIRPQLKKQRTDRRKSKNEEKQYAKKTDYFDFYGAYTHIKQH